VKGREAECQVARPDAEGSKQVKQPLRAKIVYSHQGTLQIMMKSAVACDSEILCAIMRSENSESQRIDGAE